MHYDSQLLHGAGDKDPFTGALSIPIYNASTYHQKDLNSRQEFDYSRSGNPTRKAVEATLAALEQTHHAYAFGSGMAAISSAIFAVVRQGDHILAAQDIYGGSYRFLSRFITKFGVTCSFVDTTKPELVAAAFRPETRALFLESPSNPLLKVTDIKAMADIAKHHSCVTMFDNTFLSPYFFRPAHLGIDIVIHSGTKFLGGHSDLLCGAVMTNNDALAKEIYSVQNTCGAVLGPQDCWLLLRGIKTLSVRMKSQQESAMKIALWLKKQPWITDVFYPGLPGHPGHDIITAQASGYGAVLSFKTESRDLALQMMQNVKLWTVAVSLGGVESIMSYPAVMSHAAIPEDERNKLGITDNLIRLSVGLEYFQDLIDDIYYSIQSI